MHQEKKNMSTMEARAMEFFRKKHANPFLHMYICSFCTSELSGKKPSNLVAHMRNSHLGVFVTKIKLPDKSPAIHLSIKRLKLLQNCVLTTTIDQQPFTAILKCGFQAIIASKLNKFEKAGISLNLTDPNLFVVKNHIARTAQKIREKIKNEMKDRFFSLMADAATKNNRSVLGISAQYIMDGNLKIRSLGVKELTKSHTGRYLSSVVRDCVKFFDCDVYQAISMTTDNASNMKKMIQELNGAVCESFEENSNIQNHTNDVDSISGEKTTPNDHQTYDFQIEKFLENINELEAAEFNALILNDDEDIGLGIEYELAQAIVEDFTDPPIFLNRINCTAHTLQLVVSDALKELKIEHQNVIKLCREFAKFVRRQTSINELKAEAIKIKFPKFDCVTRWSSTYKMVSL